MWSFTDPFWDTVFKWATISALMFGGIGVASAFVSAWVGYEITDATQKDADKRIADAKRDAGSAIERAARLEKEAEQLRNANLALEKEIAPRRLRSDQLAKIISILLSHAKPVMLLSYALDVESATLGEQLANTLRDGKLPFIDGLMSIAALGGIQTGINISGSDGELVDELVRAVESFGLAVWRQEPPPTVGITLGNLNQPAPAKIFIGVKPLP
jgi:hypothetical protein